MRPIIRLFFKTLRLILGPFMLLWEQLTKPKGVVRSAEDQASVDEAASRLALYEFSTCPFCIKVRQTMRRLSLNIERRNAQPEGEHRTRLAQEGGEVKVPCLLIQEADGSSKWLYESDAINGWLEQEFG